MRKKMISIAILLPLLLTCGIFSMVYTQSAVHACLPLIESAQEHAQRREWAQAEQLIGSAEATFLKKEQLLRVWTAHAVVDTVLQELQQVRTGLRLADESGVFEHFIALTYAVSNLDEYDDVSVVNIF